MVWYIVGYGECHIFFILLDGNIIWCFMNMTIFHGFGMVDLSSVGEYGNGILSFFLLVHPCLFVFVQWSYNLYCYAETDVVINDARNV